MGIIFELIFPLDGHTYRGCFSDIDADIQQSCKNDNMGKNCTLCENINGVKGCNNGVSICFLLSKKNQIDSFLMKTIRSLDFSCTPIAMPFVRWRFEIRLLQGN